MKPPTRKKPPMNPKPQPIIKIEDFGNGVIINWKVYK